MVETYVVHIYRRGESDVELTGTVEIIGPGVRRSFSTMAELWNCLATCSPTRRGPKSRKQGPDSDRSK